MRRDGDGKPKNHTRLVHKIQTYKMIKFNNNKQQQQQNEESINFSPFL